MADIGLVIDPSASSLALHDRANGRRVLGYDAPTPQLSSQFASSIDTEGARRAALHYENREITARILIEAASDAALQALENALGQKIGKLAREGGELRFAYPTGTTITFTVVEATFTRTFDIADVARKRAVYDLSFTCLPFGLGAEIDCGDNVETSLPCLIFTEASIPGDAPGRGRLVIDEDSGASQWWLILGGPVEVLFVFGERGPLLRRGRQNRDGRFRDCGRSVGRVGRRVERDAQHGVAHRVPGDP